MAKTLLILTTAGRLHWLKRAVESLRDAIDVLVVDDATPEEIGIGSFCRDKGIQFITKPKPKGLTDTWNIGYHYFASHSYIYCILSNDDVRFAKGFSVEIKHALNAKFSLVGPVTNRPGLPLHQGVKKFIRAERDWSKVDEIQRALIGKFQSDRFQPCADVSGFCFAFSKTIHRFKFASGNLFNPANINVDNEYDLAKRVRRNGGRITICRTAYVYHEKMGTYKELGWPTISGHRNRLWTYSKDEVKQNENLPTVDNKPKESKLKAKDTFLQVKQFFRCLESGKTSPNFIEVLPRSLTIDPDYWTTKAEKYFENNMLFREIERMPSEEIVTPEMRELFNLPGNTIKVTEAEFFSRLQNRLKDIIVEHWKPEANHVIVHSSGRDSRILSWLIAQIFRERGPKWLGNTIFLCSKWEGPPFKEIMKHEGWKESQFLVIGDGMKDEDVFAPILLDFKNVWRMCNGSFTNPFNMFIYFPEIAHEKRGFPLDNLQMWTGYFGDEFGPECLKSDAGQALEWMFEHLYCIPTYTSRPMIGETIHIFTDIEYLRLISQFSIRLKGEFRQTFLAWMDPKLSKFRNLNVSGHQRVRINDRALAVSLKSYRKSWYGRNIRPNLAWGNRSGFYSPMISYWTIASLCEHLIKNGYQIRKGK